MRLIPKEKLIDLIIYDLRDFQKIASKLYNIEMEIILMSRIKEVYNLHYTLNNEQKTLILDLFIRFIYNSYLLSEFKKELEEILKDEFK